MNVLYYDLTFPIGHKYFDEKTIDNLAAISQLTVVCPRNWYRKKNSTVKYIYEAEELPYSTATTKKIFFNAIHNSKIVKKIVAQEDFDAIVIGKFDHFSMPFVISILGTKIPVFVIHHNEIDQLNVDGIKGKIKGFFFRFFRRKVFHCVLEDFIKDYLICKERIVPNNVCCWPHPVERENICCTTNRLYDCIGISTSNNQQFVEDIYKEELLTKKIKNEECHIVLRSKNINFNDGFLKVFSGWINDEEYRHYFENAKSVLIAFKNGYSYRVSASIFDAFSHNIPVLCTDMPLARYYSDRYPNICHIIQDDIVMSIKKVNAICNSEEQNKQFLEFYKNHSDQIIQKKMREDLLKIVGEK